jgi:hypothetical protein
MRARVDSGDGHPIDIVQRIYCLEFLEKLGRRFEFHATAPENAARIVRMGLNYVVARRREDMADTLKSVHQVRALKRSLHAFQTALESGENFDLPDVLAMGAVRANMASDAASDDKNDTNGDVLFHELSRLLDVLDYGLDEEIRLNLRKPGPRINLGLENMAMQVSQFFKIELNGRPFTIDQHKPFKATQAFDFVKALVDPLDDVTQNEIITAIRSAKSRLIKVEK